MFSWILANLATIIICTALIVMVGAIIIYLIRNKKRGKTSCGGGCEGCAASQNCRVKQ